MTMILALTGPGRCGKDHVCREFIEYAAGQGVPFHRYALADFLKEILCFVLNISPEELEARKDDPVAPTRRLMIDFSEKYIKQVDKCFWIKKFEKDIQDRGGNYVLTDMRYWEEFYFLEQMHVRLLRVYILNRIGTPVVTGCGLQIRPDFCDLEFENVMDSGQRFTQYAMILDRFMVRSWV